MDPLSQAVIGAALPQSLARTSEARAALTLGALSGMAPDLDVLVQSPTDPLLFLEFHRQFTHSLVFIPIGALVCAVAFYPVARRFITFRRAYFFCLLGFSTHGLLDACTSYGTQLLWPFAITRVAWNNISVVDPILTVPALVLIAAASWRRSLPLARVALCWVLIYLTIGVFQRDRAYEAGAEIAASRGHTPERLEVKPGFGNLLLWKAIYEVDGVYYVDAIRMGVSARVYPGASIHKLDVARDFTWLDPDSQQAIDIERFRWFSSDFLGVRGDEVLDVRYSVVPNEIDPLWSIKLAKAAASGDHVDWITRRSAGADQRGSITAMLRGKSLAPSHR
jgi:inner membrane protein